MMEEGSKGWQEFCSENSRFAGGLSGWVNRLTVTGSLNGRDREKAARGSGTEGGSDPETASKCSFSREGKKAKVSRITGQGHPRLHWSNWLRETTVVPQRERELVWVSVREIYRARFAHCFSIKRFFKQSAVGQISCYSLFYVNFLVKHSRNLANPSWGKVWEETEVSPDTRNTSMLFVSKYVLWNLRCFDIFTSGITLMQDKNLVLSYSNYRWSPE